MAEKKTIYFRLFGSFAYRQSAKEKWKQLDGSVPCGRKLRSFIEYLIVNHDSDISSEDLREKFWPADKSVNPSSSLKYTMHKARAVLSAMFPEYADDLIWTVRGYFIWNPDIKVKTDIEDFAGKCRSIRKKRKEIPVEDYLSVIRMYSGEILPGSNMDWMRSLRLYYRTLYIDMCKTAVMKLQDEGRWEDIAAVSEKAYSLEPGVEEFTVYYMQALTALGQPERTLEHYEIYKKYIWKKHHQIPSGQVEQVYALAVQTIANGISEGSEIFEMLTDCSRDRHAFLCSFNVFRNIVNLEMRHIERDKHTSSIVILSVFGEKTGEAEAAALSRMEKVILETLRTGDPVTRLNSGSFAILLSGATEANAEVVVERISAAFSRKYRSAGLRTVHQTFAMTPKNKNGRS